MFVLVDSTGDPMPKEIEKWVNRITNQASSLGLSLQLEVNTIEHQKKDSECGIYSIYFRSNASSKPSTVIYQENSR